MATDTISFSVTGEITLDTLSASLDALRTLLSRLSSELAPDADIRWIVNELKAGSVHTTLRGSVAEAGSVDDVDAVTRGYAAIGRAVQQGDEPPCGDMVVEAVEELLSAAKQGGTEATIEAGGKSSTINLQTWRPRSAAGQSRAIGSVIGIIKGINASRQPYVSVYEPNGGSAVRCFVDDQQLKWALSAWGETVYIQGQLTRDRASRRKREIRRIINYHVMGVDRVRRFEDAFGVGNWQPGDPTSVELIRASRDSS